jgi:membrane protein YqaA with SNARE-associated domain
MGFLDYPFIYMFLTSFGAATLLPFGCEAIYIAYLAKGIEPFSLTFVASVANILGGVVNYYIGLWLHKKNDTKHLVSEKRLATAKTLFDKYGGLSLLFSWVFILGDPLTIAAGVLRYNFWKFLALMSLGKIARFLFLWAGVVGFMKLWG